MAWGEIGIFIVLVLAAHALGSLIANRLNFGSGSIKWVCAQAFGLIGLIAVGGLLSLISALRPWPVGVLLFGLAGTQLCFLARRGIRPLRLSAPLSGWETLLLLGIGFHLTAGLMHALAPPVWGDGLHSLFVFARDYGREGHVFFQPYVYSSRPQNMVMLFTLVQLFGRAEASQLVTWWFGVLCVIAVISVGSRLADRRIGILAGLMVVTMPLVGLLLGTGMSDLGVLLYALLGLWALMSCFGEIERPFLWAGMAGVFIGAAVGFKATGLSICLAATIIAVLEILRRRRGLGRAMLIGAVFLIFAAPWYIYAWVNTGDFFYSGGRITSGPYATEKSAKVVSTYPGNSKSRADLVAKPGKTKEYSYLTLSQIVNRFSRDRHQPISGLWRVNTMDGHRKRAVGFLILALSPLVLVIRPRNRAIVWLVLAGAGYVGLTSLLFGAYARYSLPGLALMTFGAAWSWWQLGKLGRFGRAIAVLVLAVGWGAVFPLAGYALMKDAPVALGLIDRNTYLTEAFPQAWPMHKWANENLPDQAKVLLIAESRTYFLDRDYVIGTLARNPIINYRDARNPEGLKRLFLNTGATHAMINFQISDNAWEINGKSSEVSKYRDWVRTWAEADLEEIHRQGSIHLYRITRDGQSD